MLPDPTLFDAARPVKPIEYRNVEDFPGYRVGDDGSVWTRWAYNGHQPRKLSDHWKRMKPGPDGDGYLAVNLFRDRKAHRRKVHLLVLAAFVGPRPPGLEGCHNNGVLSDCSAGNLRWDTHAANMADRLKHGTHCRGERSGNAKLTEESVRQIKLALRGGEQKKRIAARYGVSPSCISGIARGVLWGWLEVGHATH